MTPLKTLVVGCGNMGTSHARAYDKLQGFKIVGLVSRNPKSRNRLSQELHGVDTFSDYETALHTTQPDVVSINTYPDTHFEFAMKALENNAHVFVEKPLALTVEKAQKLVDFALEKEKKLVVGYILRVHPTWKRFTELAQGLGKPLVMRMNLNQQSAGQNWYTHQQLMKSISPIVDCGVHYVDIMCSMTQSNPISVSAIGAKLSDEISDSMYNYGQLQVRFQDGSVGWYEAGWGPMMSETAFFVKDVIGPKGSVSIADLDKGASEAIEGHTKTGSLLLHHSELDENGEFTHKDEAINTEEEPDHDGLCLLEQEFLLKVIKENMDITSHLNDAVNSLKIVLAADESVRTVQTVYL